MTPAPLKTGTGEFRAHAPEHHEPSECGGPATSVSCCADLRRDGLAKPLAAAAGQTVLMAKEPSWQLALAALPRKPCSSVVGCSPPRAPSDAAAAAASAGCASSASCTHSSSASSSASSSSS
eukprot:CAMPEP_0177330402 /NCGR_PEP_ID=MMETSP0368-20130122/20501_1 /TAXON_ID=447022 ORGANISM="Scrippsiella hangoei-like, Strain SHHI-4" /NCGR_SAMPLE_ID=MMETSP0368 /ASSEMBLY_ACC=CAM_ASM_000363 /LENGTH=121 /DNA_ID=CAMNT_0018790721 /DNA_START=50 /DNA_END=412 /DNA_ORIENTATION=-